MSEKPIRTAFRIADKPNVYGIWQIVWTEGRRSLRASTRETDRGAANLVLAKFINEADHATAPEPGKGHTLNKGQPLTVAELLDFYERTHCRERVVDQERIKYASRPIVEHFGAMLPAEIDDGDIVRYAELRRAGTIGRPVENGTIRRELEHLRAGLLYAAKNRRSTGVLKDDLPDIALPARAESKSLVLTPAELDRLMAKAQTDQDEPLSRAYLFIALARYTAARASSIEALTWDRVHFDTGRIDYREPGRVVTKKRRVSIPIDDELRPILERAKAEKVSEFVLGHSGSTKKTFATAAKAAGMPAGTTRHTLRHTWATAAAERGVPLYKIAAFLGDTQETVTRVYAHVTEETTTGVLPDRRADLRAKPSDARDSGATYSGQLRTVGTDDDLKSTG